MEARYHTMAELLELFPNNPTILDAVIKTEDHINRVAQEGGKIMVSISGGSDSDIMLDMFERLGYDEGEVVYVWFDTGLEYDTTKRHLKDLEAKYGVEIKRYRPEMTVAQACKKFGVPFHSKLDSSKIKKLQAKGFRWESKRLEDLSVEYENAMDGLKWWCNAHTPRFSIGRSFALKAFMVQNHPPKIFDQCCEYAKKNVSKKAESELGASLGVVGIRRAEGGVRALSLQSCFSEETDRHIA